MVAHSPLYWFYTFLHPVMMWVLLGISGYVLYSGLQIRRMRSTNGALRKTLAKRKFPLKHYQIGSLLLAVMVVGSIAGIAVTYVNNGKLFVGPHLIAGLGMTALVPVAASLAPLMQRGNNMARQIHIVLSVLILGLFGWETVTGMEIVQKILEQG